MDSGFVLQCRGEITLRYDGRDVTPKQRKGRALLAILAAEQGPLSRIRIVDLLWSDRQEEQGRASLRTLLADLKAEFGECFGELLLVERDRLALGPGVRDDLTEAFNNARREPFGGLDHLDPELDNWLRLERERWAATSAPNEPATMPARERRAFNPRIAWAVVLTLALAASLALFQLRRQQVPHQLTLMVAPDLSGNPRAAALIERVRDELSGRPDIALVGSETAASVVQGKLVPISLHRRLGVDRIFSTEVGPVGTITAKLVDARTGAELWSIHQSADQSPQAVFDDEVLEALRDAIGRASNPVPAGQWYAGEAGATLARARRLLREDQPESAMAARNLLLPAVASNPDNPLLLSLLAQATMAASDHVYAGGILPLGQARAEARRYANRAIQLAPGQAAGYAALGASYMELAQAIPALERAVALEPNDAVLQMRLGRALEFDDRYDEALVHQQTALGLDPLSPQPLIGVIRAAVQLNQTDLIRETIARYSTRDPAPARESIGYVRAYFAFLNDDNVACVREFRGSSVVQRDRRQRNVLLFCLMALGERDQARALVADEDSMRKDVLWGDIAALDRRARQVGPAFFQQHYDSVAASELLVRAGHWKTIVDLFDRGYSSIQEFKDEGGFFTLYPGSLWRAMKNAGRDEEARQLRNMLFDNWRDIESRGGVDFWGSFNGATIALADGHVDRAIGLLERCYPTCEFAVLLRDISETAMFHPLVGNPRFDRLIRRYRQMINRQRATLGLSALPLE